MIEINLQILIIQAVSFLVSVFLLWKLTWKPLTKFMENRKHIIEEDITKAKNSRENASKTEEELKTRLNRIDEEAKDILRNAVIEGRKDREDIIKEAQIEAKKIIENAKQEIEKEKLQAKNELQKEVVGLSLLMAEKVLKESVDKKIQQKLLNEFAEGLKNE